MDERIKEVRQTSEGSVYLKDDQGNIAGFSGTPKRGIQDAQGVHLVDGEGPIGQYLTTDEFPEDSVVIYTTLSAAED
jgi:hypothetical protein